jgi:hypothetical protein
MKTILKMAILLLAVGCGYEGEPLPEDAPQFVPGVTHDETGTHDQAATAPSEPGKWTDYTSCAGSVLSGVYASDFGFNPPAVMGTVPLACRPTTGVDLPAECSWGGDLVVPSDCQKTAAGQIFNCTYSTGVVACKVRVNSDGTIAIVSHSPTHSMRVRPKF